MENNPDFIERSARSYYFTYGTRFLAINAIEHEINEEQAKPFPQKTKIATHKKIIEYLKDADNSMVII